MNRRPRVEMSELARWAICGAVMVFAHASAAAIIATWPDPIMSSEPAGAITIDLAPFPVAPADAQDNVAPGPQMVQADTPLEQKPDDKAEDKPSEPTMTETVVAEDKVEPPPVDQPQADPAPLAPKAEVTNAVPKPVQHKDKPKKTRPPSLATTAPQRAPHLASVAAAPLHGQTSSSSNALPSWKGQIVAAIERNKRYPAEAESRREQGTPSVSFSIDRSGRLLASRLARASGYSALDQEALAILRRAQPFPPPPADLIGARFDFTVPIRFTVR